MRKLLIFVSLLLCVGCAPNFTLIDSRGNPLPHEFIQLRSLYGLHTDFHFKRMYYEGTESLYPEFLPIEKEVTLPRDTREVALVLHIFNPETVRLRVRKHLKVNGKRTEYIVYEGSDLDRVFQLKGPIAGGAHVELYATIEVNNRIVVLAGRALYKTRKDTK